MSSLTLLYHDSLRNIIRTNYSLDKFTITKKNSRLPITNTPTKEKEVPKLSMNPSFVEIQDYIVPDEDSDEYKLQNGREALEKLNDKMQDMFKSMETQIVENRGDTKLTQETYDLYVQTNKKLWNDRNKLREQWDDLDEKDKKQKTENLEKQKQLAYKAAKSFYQELNIDPHENDSERVTMYKHGLFSMGQWILQILDDKKQKHQELFDSYLEKNNFQDVIDKWKTLSSEDPKEIEQYIQDNPLLLRKISNDEQKMSL